MSWSAAFPKPSFKLSEAGPCVDGTAKAVAKASAPVDLLDMGEKPAAAAPAADLLSFGQTPEKVRDADLLSGGDGSEVLGLTKPRPVKSWLFRVFFYCEQGSDTT